VRVLLTGAAGQLGVDLQRRFASEPQHDLTPSDIGDLDVTDRDLVHQLIGELRPDLVLHVAAWTAVDACEGDPQRAWAVNALGSRHVAEASTRAGAHVVYVSTDYVFDGESDTPYVEWDHTNPRTVYGRSKLGGEREVLEGMVGAAVVRTSWLCGQHGSNMVKTILELSKGPAVLAFVDDQHGCPTFTDDLAGMIYRIAVARMSGVFHVTNQGATTWYQFARDVLEAAGRDPDRVKPITTAELVPPRPAPRPANSVLDNAVLRASGMGLLPEHRETLARTVDALVETGL